VTVLSEHQGAPATPHLAERPTLVRMEDVSVRLGSAPDAPALIESVSLEIRAGETLGLVGESGSGRTTLGLALMRLLPPNLDRGLSGRILYGGTDVARFRRGPRSRTSASRRRKRVWRTFRIS
jgi:ABC-type glutathione transport system ATPase component